MDNVSRRVFLKQAGVLGVSAFIPWKPQVEEEPSGALPQRVPGRLFAIGSMLVAGDMWRVNWQATRIVIPRWRRAAQAQGYQMVGNAQLVPAEKDGLLLVRLIVHYVGKEEAARVPNICLADLPPGIVESCPDPGALAHLKSLD